MKFLRGPIHQLIQFAIGPAAQASGFPPVVEAAANDTIQTGQQYEVHAVIYAGARASQG
jgi:hypothetical protein